jgi:hypothetical protein
MTPSPPDRRAGNPAPRERRWEDDERDRYRAELALQMPASKGNGLNFRLPGGWGIEASGRDVVLILVILAGFAGSGWITYTGFRALIDANHAALAALTERGKEHLTLSQGSRDLVCLLAIPAEDRPDAVRSRDVCGYAIAIPLRRAR